MSATQVLAQLDELPVEEQRQVFEQLREKFEDEPTPEQIAELDRRAARALAHPERCRPLDDVVADMEKRFRAKQ
jgi:hypothetical protein